MVMVNLLKKDWVLLQVSGFTPIMKIESIFISKTLTYVFSQENNKHKLHRLLNICQVFLIVATASSFSFFIFFVFFSLDFCWCFSSNFGEDLVHLCFATFIHFIAKSMHYKIINQFVLEGLTDHHCSMLIVTVTKITIHVSNLLEQNYSLSIKIF